MSALEGASKYLNNLLLARGLLSDGKSIDFAHPANDDGKPDATMSKVINLVHELVLRRDREHEQHEVMASSIRNFRATEAQHILDIQQMQDKNHQLKNDISTVQGRERMARSDLRRLEIQVKELKEQNLKMKSMLDQVRAKCVSDIRKRDVEIEKLKGHLLGLQRGKKEIGGMKINVLKSRTAGAERTRPGGQDVHSADWTLDKETNDLLAALVNETSAENVSLRKLVNDTAEVLKEMSGFEDEVRVEEEDGVGIPGQYRKSRQTNTDTLIPVDSLTEQMDLVLQHCKTILKDPSFVPIEEVQLREEEIAKLKAGWEKMADRWKEAVTMMGQWKQKMMSEGKSAEVEEFSDLSFGRSVAVRPDGQPVLGRSHELSLIFEESKIENDGQATIPCTAIYTEETPEQESDLDLEPESEHATKRLASSPAKRGIRLHKLAQPLSETKGNVQVASIVTRVPPHDLSMSFGENDENGIIEPDSPSLKLTVPQKLAAIEREAEKSQQGRQYGTGRKRKLFSDNARTRKSSRRRSTLSPEELAEMMGMT